MPSTAPYGQTSSTIWGPCSVSHCPHRSTSSKDDTVLEISVHTLPRPLYREFQHIFDERTLEPVSEKADQLESLELLAIPTNQQAREDLVSVGDHVEQEKDRLLNTFMLFARDFCARVRNAGYWCDYIDPCSGLPMMTHNCNKVYSEVDGMECCLGYKSYNAGFCKILTHPKWGSSVYPATIFARAPRSVIVDIVRSYPLAME